MRLYFERKLVLNNFTMDKVKPTITKKLCSERKRMRT